MRCSSCEALLGSYIERSLSPASARTVARHVEACAACQGLLRELRVVDALLATARPADAIPPGFTDAVMAATPAQPVAVRRFPVWLALSLYLAAAWAIAALAAIRLRGDGALLDRLLGTEELVTAAIGAVTHALAPFTPVAALAVTSVLILDLVLIAVLFASYRLARPLLRFHLANGPKHP